MNKQWQDQLDKWERRRARFRELVAQGWTYRKIAEREGLSTQRVHQIVSKKEKANEKKTY